MKQGHNVINDWRKRWFMLRGRTLFYSKSREVLLLLSYSKIIFFRKLKKFISN